MLKPVDAEYAFTANLAGEDGGKAKDISGIACMPLADGRLRCLLVNDENAGAQFVEIEGFAITPREEVPLIGTEAPPDALGVAPPVHHCSGGDDAFGEFDGEGVAYEAPYFYVAGSHGCSRKRNTFRLSSFYLARFEVDAQGRQAGPVETTYRLGDALSTAPTVGDFFGRNLMDGANGLNVEGIAVLGGRLHAGLRAPSLDGKAFIISVAVDDLFAPGQERLQAKPEMQALDVGQGAGIRDLSVLPDGRFLVLTGPAQAQDDVPYTLVVGEPGKSDSFRKLGVLEPLPADQSKGKAEAITLIGENRVLVLFDGLRNGAPRAYDIPLGG